MGKRLKKAKQVRRDCYSLDVSFIEWLLPRLNFLESLERERYKNLTEENAIEKQQAGELADALKLMQELFTKHLTELPLSNYSQELSHAMFLFHKYLEQLWY